MYAVFEDGSRQYRVSEGDLVRIDFRDAVPGTRLELKRVLLYQNTGDTRVGQPVVEGMRILAEVEDHPTEKTYIQKFRRRKTYRRFRGHRQPYTEVRIRSILLPGQEPPAEKPAEKPPEPAAEKPAEKPPEPAAEKPPEPAAEKPPEPAAEKPATEEAAKS